MKQDIKKKLNFLFVFTMGRIFYLSKDFAESDICKKLKEQLNRIDYQFIVNWRQRFNDHEFKYMILERGEHEDGPDIMNFPTFDKAVVQLIMDTLDDIGSEFELDKVPMNLIKDFCENDIDGGVLYLASDYIKVEQLMQMPEIEKKIYNYKLIKNRYEKLKDKKISLYGKKFLLTFKLIKIVLDNDLIINADLKERTVKFYSCYQKYMKIKKEEEIAHIIKIKEEIKELSDDTRKQMIYNLQIKRTEASISFDEFLYWSYLLKAGDIFEYDNKRFEVVEVEIYPHKINSSNAKTNHAAVIKIKNVNEEENGSFSCNFPQYYESGESAIKFVNV